MPQTRTLVISLIVIGVIALIVLGVILFFSSDAWKAGLASTSRLAEVGTDVAEGVDIFSGTQEAEGMPSLTVTQTPE